MEINFNIVSIFKKVLFTAFSFGLLYPATLSYATDAPLNLEEISLQDKAWRWRWRSR